MATITQRRLGVTLVGAVLVAVSLMGTACSSPHSTSPPGGAATSDSGDQAFLDFARCMRSHGVPMADPSHRPGHAGLSIDLPQQTRANAAAYAACDHYLRSLNEQKQAGRPPVPAAKLTALTKYARCMRAHAIALLDPDPQGTVRMGPAAGISTIVGRNSPQFHTADTACRHLLPSDVYDDGTGP